MYALKMLDYKNDGKVICTQPRIGPTNTNSNRISEELGVPIQEYSILLKEKIKTDNYYVQYSHSNDSHKMENNNHLTLKLLTDGTLLSEIIKNPMLKEEIPINSNNKNIIYNKKYEIAYIDKNKYDIIIIDEAHEHNTNMDLILTLARQSCFMNNDIKLVIMSATMDDDEPNFRRFYHLINDNLVYPLKEKFFNFFNNDEFFYDSIYLDRRFHIAPPGKSTQYDIKEIYLENGNTNDIVRNIIQSSTFGDILVFENGTNEIMKRVKILNEITPSNVIAIPYLGTGLNQKYKDIIENLKSMISKIRTSKKLVDTIWNENYTVSKDVPEGTYNRAIIVATNVAEASLTIENLKFVIDNGYAKVNNYNDIRDKTELNEEPISEASRKQRKGRVGRVSSGTVYYLYKKGDKESIKPKYKINQEDFGKNLIALLEKRSLNDKDQFLVPLIDYLDPNNSNYQIINKEELLYFIEEIKDQIYYKKNIFAIQQNQFNSEDYKIYWNTKYFNNNLQEFMYRKESGYQMNIILDRFGLFYIIHPKENLIKRNILGNIIQYFDNTKNEWIETNKFLDYMFQNTLIIQSDKYFLVNMGNNFIGLAENKINDSLLYKTEFFEYLIKLEEIIESYDFTTYDFITLLTSEAYGSFIEVLEVMTMLKTIKNSMKNLILDLNLYCDQDNEIEFIKILIDKMKIKFNHFNIFNIKNYENLKKNYTNVIDTKINEFLNEKKIYKKDPPIKYTANEWNKLNYLYLSGKIKKGFDELVTDVLDSNDNINNFYNYEKEINEWSKLNNINSNILIEYLKNYKKYIFKFLTRNKNNIDETEIDPLNEMTNEATSFIKSLTCKNDYEKIIRPFIHGQPFNIAIKMNSTDINHTTIPYTPIINIDSKKNINNLLFYYKSDIKNDNIDSMSITNKINVEWLLNILPTYYKPSTFQNVIYKKNGKNIDKYILTGDLFNNFCVDFKNKWSINNLPFESSKKEILGNYIKNIKKELLLYEKK
jgi:hypothetical protein